MTVSTKTIKGRIRSIGNTKKITKAMEMVSAAKMRRAVEHMLASRAYAATAWEVVTRLAERTEEQTHPLLVVRKPVQTIAIIIVSSNRGLCGSFNANIAAVALGARQDNVETSYITMGEKAQEAVRRAGATVVAHFEKPDMTTSTTVVSGMTQLVIDAFLKGVYDRVYIAYTDFKSSLRQMPRIKQLLPFKAEEDTELGAVKKQQDAEKEQREDYEYLFEPAAGDILEFLLPRLVELQLYQAVLESDASEHSARMFAMRNATDAAGEMIDDLTLAFNQARQAGITAEIAEISGGKAALENN